MKINPRELSWGRVTTRVDGSDIPGEVNYALGVDYGDTIEEMFVVVGSLQPGGVYVAPIGDMEFSPGVTTIALRATEVDSGLTSAWSNTATFEIVTAAPTAPFAVAVE